MKVRGLVSARARKSVTARWRTLVLGVNAAAVAAFALISLAPLGHAQAAGADSAMIVGRVTFRDSVHQAKAEEVERLRWGRLVVEMRRGWDMYSANPDGNGFFSISGPPGTYRLDYVRVGQLSEFVAPHEVKARAGQVTCLGTLEISVADLGRDLGNNNGSQLQVRDDCAALAPEVHLLGDTDAAIRTSVAAPVVHHRTGPSALEIAAGLRGVVLANDKGTTYGATWLVPITEDTGSGNFVAEAQLLYLSSTFESRNRNDAGNIPGVPAKWGGAVGAGYSIWLVEVLLHGGVLAGDAPAEHGPMLGGSLRLGTHLLGIGLEIERYPSANSQLQLLMLDLSPVALLGSLL
jgi:hypothetical protein